MREGWREGVREGWREGAIKAFDPRRSYQKCWERLKAARRDGGKEGEVRKGRSEEGRKTRKEKEREEKRQN